MSSPERLHGTELIDCARANGKYGAEVAAERSGYGKDLTTFEHELKKACDHIGVEFHNFNDLVTPHESVEEGIEVAPESPSRL